MRVCIGAIAALLLAVAFAVWRLSEHDLDWRRSTRFDFASDGHAIAGTLWLPNAAPLAAVVLVHGDGAQDRSAAGGYAPLIHAFLDRGIAVAAWDKPGVGASEGNWLDQSMADRCKETRAALHALDMRFDGIALGAVGFSQAGWVLPGLTSADAGFLVLIGPAVSWQDQGDYYTRVRLAREGLEQGAIARVLAEQHQRDDRAFGPDAQASDAPEGMSLDRWQFIRRNRSADAREALAQLDLPLLAVWGAEDLNVDATGDAAIYADLLAAQDDRTRAMIWPEATHGLLKSKAYNWQLVGDWSQFAKLRFILEGRHAYVPGALDMILDWIEHRSRDAS
ncbi:S9 family peptidase [Phaeobacter sp. HF9A]|uniref:alpha/beta hydrolase family protein n=1 Tax=Phaeobacter sp. HF9A TaxID=2721561 RepID=UPI0015887DFB|nr:alpha/beta hydrolase [Phaeobacter sp. HF9A]